MDDRTAIELKVLRYDSQCQKPDTLYEDKEPPGHGPEAAESDGMLSMETLIKALVKQPINHGVPVRNLGVMFRNLRVVGLGGGTAVQRNLVSLFYPRSIMKYVDTLRHPPVRDIISGFDGVVLPGEMLLVLGRPGSGCSTFLKTLANHRGEYHDVFGDVFYSSFTSEEIARQYRGDVIYCPEDDVHFTTLTVSETLQFASTMRTPGRRVESRLRAARAAYTAGLLQRIFGIKHASNTAIGDASHRGISGGEKKRVSIAETMSARGKLICWDNSTRGLDSSTALEFIQALRVATDTAKVTTIVSIYQVGEQLFELFDKLCLICDGKMAYFGPAKEAKQYMMNMGYEPQNRQTTADFLVASTDPNGRKFRHGFQGVIPRTADEIAAYFRTSVYSELNQLSLDSYRKLYVSKPGLKVAYEMSVTTERAQNAPKNQSYTLSIPMQIQEVIRRRWQILKGDWATQAVIVGSQISQALFIGTLFFRMANHTSTYFSRGSVLYFSLFCGSFMSMVEIPSLFSQRRIVLRHQKGALYYPFIEAFATTIVDIPITFMSILVMAVTFYFLVGLQNTARQFFIFFLFTFSVTLVMKACFRAVAATRRSETGAVAMAGVILLAMVLSTGYAIPAGNIVWPLHIVTDLNPLYFAFESLVVNEFHTIEGTCTTLVPSGPGYENVTLANQVCATVGSQPGMATVSGDAYIQASFGYSFAHLWRNLGILGAFGFVFLVAFLYYSQYNKLTVRDATLTLYKEGSKQASPRQATDEERATIDNLHDAECRAVENGAEDISISTQSRQTDVFSWKCIQYEVPVAGGKLRRLLDDVSGYVAPGKLTALMGESGAGKTTLLDVLAQRVDSGIVRGDCLVNGQPLPADFAAQTAYVQQLDTHVPESTVREALLFSARLRQPPSVPAAEREAYVDKCLKMCGLESYADAIVGTLGVEQRKRTTIGVELAARPKLLFFLDEPTSGLDSQSAWAIVKVLRELADNGQAILCTIHQPSGELFQLFDRVLLLRKGGRTVYFGDVGERSMTMIEYFQRNGAPYCPPDANPAEYMLDVIGAGARATCTTDWHQIWKDSPEAARMDVEIEHIRTEGLSRPVGNTRLRREFASSWMKQVALLTCRGFVCCWRSPTYIYSKLIVCTIAGALIGFTFLGSKNTLQGVEDRLFSAFMTAALCLPMSQQLQIKFIESRTVYEVRERPSKMFTWTAFLVSQTLVEIPWNILGMSLLFACWYWPTGFDSSRAGYSYIFCCVVFPLYYITSGQAVAVISANEVMAFAFSAVVYSFLFIFAGVLQRYSELGWWKWMYYVSPMTYIVDGLFGQAVGKQLITCTSSELVMINPPSGMNCGAYMDPFISFAGGYLTDPDATAECSFCPFRTTDEYLMSNLHMSYGHHWRDLGIVVGFAGFNVLCMFAGMYFFRIHRLKSVTSLLARFKHAFEKRR